MKEAIPDSIETTKIDTPFSVAKEGERDAYLEKAKGHTPLDLGYAIREKDNPIHPTISAATEREDGNSRLWLPPDTWKEVCDLVVEAFELEGYEAEIFEILQAEGTLKVQSIQQMFQLHVAPQGFPEFFGSIKRHIFSEYVIKNTPEDCDLCIHQFFTDRQEGDPELYVLSSTRHATVPVNADNVSGYTQDYIDQFTDMLDPQEDEYLKIEKLIYPRIKSMAEDERVQKILDMSEEEIEERVEDKMGMWEQPSPTPQKKPPTQPHRGGKKTIERISSNYPDTTAIKKPE